MLKKAIRVINDKKVYLLIWLAFICAYVFLYGNNELKVGNINLPRGVVDEITSDREYRAPIRYDSVFTVGIESIELLLASYGRRNSSNYNIAIYSMDGDLLLSEDFNASEVEDNEFFEVAVNGRLSTNNDYYLVLSSPDAELDNSITAYYNRDYNHLDNIGIVDVGADIVSNANPNKLTVTISREAAVLCLVVMFLGFFMIFILDGTPHRFAFFIVLLFGGLFALVVPPSLSPDEYAHYTATIKLLLRPLDKTTFFTMVRKLPSTVGLIVGSGNYYAGRIFNTLTCAALVCFGIKLAPRHKYILLVTAGLPLSLYISGTYNPEAVSNGLAILIIGLFLNIYYKDSEFKSRDMLFFTLAVTLISVYKITYILLFFLLLLLPLRKIKNKKQIVGVLIGLAVIVIFSFTLNKKLTGFILHIASGNFTVGSPDAVASSQIGFMLSNIPYTFNVFISSIVDSFSQGFASYFVFPYDWACVFQMPNTISFLYALFYGAILLLYPEKDKLNPLRRFALFAIGAGVVFATYLAMYMAWTPVGSNRVEGVQVRYLAPLLAIWPLVFNISPSGLNYPKRSLKKLNLNITFCVLIFAASSVLNTILTFW